ncbi:glycine cleavage system aminomethyltransferase GcvT [Thermocrinis sp.]
MNTTPFYDLHKGINAKFTEFAGYHMPLYYSSIVEEVLAVRNSVGVFDVSHMGRLWVRGKAVKQKLDFLTTNSLDKLRHGKVQYNLLINEKGGVKDDITLYMMEEDEYFLCINSANRQKVIDWLLSWDIPVEDWTFQSTQIAVQGKGAEAKISKFFEVKDIKRYNFVRFGDVIVSRTGYTGEDGFEIYAPIDVGREIFLELIKEVIPCGLGARDVLRIEAGLPLYGHEISEDISPLSANLDRFVSKDKEFIGKKAMLEREVERKLFGLEMLEKGVPREGYEIYCDGKVIGVVSSGTFSPTLKKGIALCFVDVNHRLEGKEVYISIREKSHRARLRSYPFI